MEGNSNRNASDPSHRELHRKVGTSSKAGNTTQLSASFISSSVGVSQVLQGMANSTGAQEVFIILVTGLMALWSITLYVQLLVNT